MPRGFSGVRQTSEEIQQRRSGGSAPNALWFRLNDGEEAIVRFLEQDEDIFWCMMHEIPPTGNQKYGHDKACINQDSDGTPCPGCEQELPRKFKGFINLIWYDAPIFKREDGRMVKGDDNKPIVTGNSHQVAVWGSGIRVFDDLDEINANYRGLRSRPFRIKRKGGGLNTKYTINPADPDGGPQEFKDYEKKLEAKKYDLAEFVKPASYEAFQKELGGGQSHNGSDGGQGGGTQQPRNPFMRNNS